MKILFANGHPFPPQMYGGMQSSTAALMESLNANGHETALLCGLSGSGLIALRDRILMKLFSRKAVKDHSLGVPVWRAWFPWEGVEEVLQNFKPDLVIVGARNQVRVAAEVQRAGVPVLLWLLDVEMADQGGDFQSLGNVPCVANSSFTAQRYEAAFGVKPVVIHPLVEPTRYRAETTRENVTFINPMPKKGLALAVKVAAALPHIPFSFVESWPLSDRERQFVLNELSRLKNVTLVSPTVDMRKIYGRAKILLTPSSWEEAYGRVASEAQISGIPVVASDRGGLPEAVGEGGVLLDPDGGADPWITAIKRLWEDQNFYNSLSDAAFLHAKRNAIEPKFQTQAWQEVLSTARKN